MPFEDPAAVPAVYYSTNTSQNIPIIPINLVYHTDPFSSAGGNNSSSINSQDYRYLEMQREIRKLSEEVELLKKELVEAENCIQNEKIKNFRKIKV